ncbi:lipopolysaccharide biosynthesis protein [Ectothiorhodospiraceae bacterium 2226]|nr:lipopolysaccharide biosynthesis protein [Ectothiorhodospiraceae bacterium 2226]
MEERTNTLELRDYAAFFKRRKWHIIVPLVIIMLVVATVAYGLPAMYRSSATILVEQQDIPQDLVRSTVTSYAAERIESIRHRVMTREVLMDIVERHDLFPEERAAGRVDDVVQRMRQSMLVEPVAFDVVDPRSGRQVRATIAFNVHFDARDPVKAQLVANDLAQLFLSENTRLRTQKADETANFLAAEATRLREEIAELEEKLTAYKEENRGLLPELMNVNVGMLERVERDIQNLDQRILTLTERKMYLESQLGTLNPHSQDTPQARLYALQSQYLTYSAVYGQDHPDMARMKREIDVLQKEVGSIDEGLAAQQRIMQAQAQLQELRNRYSDEHPDVARLRREIASLEERAAAEPQQGRRTPPPNNPAYINVNNELESVNLNLRAAEQQRAQLEERLEQYETRVASMPRIEQEGQQLKRDYENATAKYREIRQKQAQAEVAGQLERESRAERFVLIEEPRVPGTPERPNRLGILFLGTALSFAGGLGWASAAEYFNRVVRGARSVIGIFGAPPLAAIPYIPTVADRQRSRRRRLMMVAGGVLLAVVILMLLHGMGVLEPVWTQSGEAQG